MNRQKDASRLALRSITNSSESSSPKKLAVVSGAGGNTARTPIVKFMDRGFNVLALTSNKENLTSSVPGMQYVLVDRNQMGNPEHIQKATEEGMQKLGMKTASKIVALNLIGGAVAPKGSTLKQLNQELPVAFFKGVKSVAEARADRVSLVHISSIAATLNKNNGCDYAQIKEETDQAVLQKKPNNGNVVVLRPGIILPDPTVCGRVDMGHAYSPDQFWGARFVPLLGSGNQLQQPVSEHCLYEAALNGAESDGSSSRIINAVSAEAVTQKELFTLTSPDGKWFIHVPHSVARCIAENFPLGRIAPYSVRLFDALDQRSAEEQLVCSKDFEELLGRKPKSFKEVYQGNLVGGQAPIGQHIKAIASESLRNPEKLVALSKEFVRSISDWKITR